jgi:N-dimethylarginine dimethylaminohydrolase
VTGPHPTDSTAVRRLAQPVFLLNAPFSFSSDRANNATMRELGPRGRRLDRPRLWEQWHLLYHHLSTRALVYLLPSRAGLQDQPFVANVGLIPAHTRKPVAVVSKFRAAGRSGESKVGQAFFQALGFKTELCPAYFEGEADLKYLRRNIYFGGYGLRSSLRAHAWLEKRHDFRIIPVPLFDPHLYHLDCILHVLDPQRVLLATSACPPETVRAIGRTAEILDVPLPLAYRGATNVARLQGQILGDSPLAQLKRSDTLYSVERAKRKFLEKLAGQFALEPVFFNLSEFYKSGAMLSCLVLPLNYPHLSRPDPSTSSGPACNVMRSISGR